jgi:hypothetical protein
MRNFDINLFYISKGTIAVDYIGLKVQCIHSIGVVEY